MYTVKSVLEALDTLTGGRCIRKLSDYTEGKNPWILMKASGIPGKGCLETPGLVYGRTEKTVSKLAVCMTLTESVIELAGATGVDAIVSHHPACEAANTGGVAMSSYLGLYDLAYFEVHEAFHGLHPGIPWLHGHRPFFTDVNYGGITGNVVNVGRVLPGIHTLGQLLDRLNQSMDLETDGYMLAAERRIRGCQEIEETAVAARARILLGERDSTVKEILHIHPHCGVSPDHLRQLKGQFPDADTVVASISHVNSDHPLVNAARELGMHFVCGNSHGLEIFENGIPLAYALQNLLPGLECVIIRERQTMIPLAAAGSDKIQAYGKAIAREYLSGRH